MRVKVMENHDGEDEFPTFARGTPVYNMAPCLESKHWFSCTLDGRDTYIPEAFVVNGALRLDYAPTELRAEKGEVVEVILIVHEWLFGRNGQGVTGWLPAEKVVSIELAE